MVDDECELVKKRVSKKPDLWKDFTFAYVSEFTSDAVLQEIVKFPEDTHSVLLLDVYQGAASDHKKNEDPAGIKLFKQLNLCPAWLKRNGSVQIVFFSSAPIAKWHAEVGRAKRVDVSGFVEKNDLLSGDEKALMIFLRAVSLAELYKNNPVLADPKIRELSELAFSPNSHEMHKVWKQIVRAGRCHEPVFISGETGTGKELVAKAVFEISKAASARRLRGVKQSPGSCGVDLFSLNIAALPAEGNLQYTELFGAKKGSFTGCDGDRPGLFGLAGNAGKVGNEAAPGGTIFLDEIGDAAPIVQTTLLRVLQEKTFTPLGGFNEGGNQDKISFRLISASHSLLGNVKAGLFREDLFHRLNVLHIHLPPLRERKEDIGVLVELFVEKMNVDYKGFGWEEKKVDDIEALVNDLKRYDWPGNVRELEMAIRASWVSTDGGTFQLSEEVISKLEERESAPCINTEPRSNIELLLEKLLQNLPPLAAGDGVKHKPEGQEPTLSTNIEELLAKLLQNPMPLTEMSRNYGKHVAVQVYQALVGDGKSLDESIAKKYFGQDANTANMAKWFKRNAQANGVSSNQEEQDV